MQPSYDITSNRFDWLYEASFENQHSWNEVLCETKRGTTIASLGSLVPGWVLTFPKRPVINIAALSHKERLNIIEEVKEQSQTIAPLGDQVFHFEHGAGRIGSPVGCGLDIAHIHSVPLNFDLVEVVRKKSADVVEWSEITSIGNAWDFPMGRDYYVLWNSCNERGIVGRPKASISQLIRRIIANQIGQHQYWDYREKKFLENIQLTKKIFVADDW